MIIDTHVHAWNAESAETPWRPGWRAYAPRPSLGIDELLAAMDGAGVHAAALIPPEWDVGGNELALAGAQRHPDRIMAFPSVSLRHESSARRLDEWMSVPGFTGLRQVFLRSPGYSPLSDGSAQWLLHRADQAGLAMMVWLPDQFDLLPGLVDGYPRISFIVDHLNLGIRTGADEVSSAVVSLAKLADRPNLAVKVSALPSMATDGYPFRSTHRAVVDLVAAFGAARVFWGSDFTRLDCSYPEAVSMMTEIDALDKATVDAVMGGSFARWIKINHLER